MIYLYYSSGAFSFFQTNSLGAEVLYVVLGIVLLAVIFTLVHFGL